METSLTVKEAVQMLSELAGGGHLFVESLPYAVPRMAASESRATTGGRYGNPVEGNRLHEYAQGLRDVEPGQRIVVIFHFHRSPEFSPDLLRQHTGLGQVASY